MLGTIVNTIAIIAGSIVGYMFKNFIPEKAGETMTKAISLAVIYIGISMASKGSHTLLVISSLAVGALIGELAGLENKLDSIGVYIEKKFKSEKGNISEGFAAASIIFCVGSMAIIGAMEGGLSGKHDVLYAKSILDGVISIVMASTIGIGVLFSSISVFIYQGSIVMLATSMKNIMTDTIISEMTAVGGLLIMAIGLNFIIRERIRVGNMLPALFIPLIYFLITGII